MRVEKVRTTPVRLAPILGPEDMTDARPSLRGTVLRPVRAGHGDHGRLGRLDDRAGHGDHLAVLPAIGRLPAGFGRFRALHPFRPVRRHAPDPALLYRGRHRAPDPGFAGL